MTLLKKYHLQITAILLLSILSMHFATSVNDTNSNVALYPGCITSGNQIVTGSNLPDTIKATPATGGNCHSNYTYQWQSSTDGIWYTDIPGATGQYLIFRPQTLVATTPAVPLVANMPEQITLYHRKAICGNQVKYTSYVTVTRN